jgi:O-antigen/teichoic acid export membrane protein
VDPALLRGNLALALFILLAALMILPFQDPASGAFVVTVLAVVVALLFIAAIWLLMRYFSPRMPPKEDDK